MKYGTSVVISVVFGSLIAFFGILEFVEGSSIQSWLPQVTFGIMLGAVVVGLNVASDIGTDPSASDKLTLAHWVAAIGFCVWALVGLVYLFIGYGNLYAWGHIGIGGFGIVAVISGYIRGKRGRASRFN